MGTANISDIYSVEGGGFDWTVDNEVTINQSPAVSNLGERYLYTTATAASRTLTLPSVGSSEDGDWLAVTNASEYRMLIAASDSDTIGWPALQVTKVHMEANTQCIFRYDHSNTKWEIIEKTGAGRVAPEWTVWYPDFNLLIRDVTDTVAFVPDRARRNPAFGTLSSWYAIEGKFGESCPDMNGSSDYLQCLDDSDFSIFSGTVGGITLSGWVYHDVAASANEFYVSQWEDGSNYYSFYRTSSGALGFYRNAAGTVDISLAAGTVSATTWTHVALVKVGAETGLYINGSQVAYDATFTPDDFAGSIFFGQQGNSAGYLDGRLSDWSLVWHNIFGAAPNSTPNDSFNLDSNNPIGLIL